MSRHLINRSAAVAMAVAMLFGSVANMVAPVARAGTSPTITSDKLDYAPGDTVTLTGTGWDVGEAVHLFVNDNDGQTWSYSADVTADDQGNFSNSFQLPTWFVALYYVTATGAASGTATTTFTDANVNIVNASKPSDPTSSTSASFQFNANGGGDLSTECQLDAGGFASCTSPRPYAGLSAGSHTFVVRLAADHSKSDAYTWFVDFTPPDTIINTSPPSTTTSTSAQFTFTGSDNHTTVQARFTFQCSLDGGAYGSCTSPKNYPGPLAPGGHTFDVKATDEAGNVDPSPAHYVWTIIAADSTAPTIGFSQSPDGTNGWFTTAPATVTVTATDTDDGGVASLSCTLDGSPVALSNTGSTATTRHGDVTTSSEGDHTVSCTAADPTGNITSPAATTHLKLDTTGPTATLAVTAGTAGSNGWYTSDVTVSTSGTDSISSPVTCTADQFQTTETTGTVFNGSCTNDAGLTTNAAPLTVKLDKTGPSASLAVTAGTAGSNGWYTSDVTVSTSGTDLGSDNVICTADQFQTTETTGTVFNGSCTNDAGLTTNAAPLTVKLDKTGPSINVTGFSNGQFFFTGSPLPTVGCSVPTDATSGPNLASLSGPTITSGGLNGNGVGTVEYTCSVYDYAGNLGSNSRSFTRLYGGSSGILQPINPDNTSVFKRGQAVPVKFRLAGDEYFGFDTTGWTIQRQMVACSVFDGADAELENVLSNTPSQYFRYDPSADQYIYNADMHNLGVGTCWNFKVTLDSGQVLYSAVFKLTK